MICLFVSFPPFAFTLDCIWYLNDTKSPRMIKETHSLWGCFRQNPESTLTVGAESFAPHVLQKEISFGSGNATVVSEWSCSGVRKPCSRGQGFLSRGYVPPLTPTTASA